MIELHQLTKSYVLSNGERRYVFRDLTFGFPEGANIGLIGRNGAGKSTLLRLIGGIDTPDRGGVVTDKRISWPIGLSGGLQGGLTARDMVKFVSRVYGADRHAMLEKIQFVQDFAEIGDYFDQPVKYYSSGMRSRVNFGLSMAFDFDYYLIDEVMAVGDARFKKKSKAILAERIGQSNIIMVSHSMDEVEKLCDVVVLVQEGNAILYENVKEGIEAYISTEDTPRKRNGRRARLRDGELASEEGGPPRKTVRLLKTERMLRRLRRRARALRSDV